MRETTTYDNDLKQTLFRDHRPSAMAVGLYLALCGGADRNLIARAGIGVVENLDFYSIAFKSSPSCKC